MAVVKVTGLDAVLSNLNKEIAGIKDRTMAGLLAGGLVIQRDAQKHVPREYGNLHASAYTRKAKDEAMAVEVGFSAAYALFIHENLGQKLKGRPRASGLGVYWGPSGEPKFLERAVQRTKKDVVRVVAEHAKKKGTK